MILRSVQYNPRLSKVFFLKKLNVYLYFLKNTKVSKVRLRLILLVFSCLNF